MGWKLLKETFDISHHVTVTAAGVHIGSNYISDMVTINPKTGSITENEATSGFLARQYPRLHAASKDSLVEILAAPDTFSASVTVYTFDDGQIIQKLCENSGWPNVTHDGDIMYENRYSTDKAQVVAWAKSDIALAVSSTQERIEQAEHRLRELRDQLALYEQRQRELDEKHPAQ